MAVREEDREGEGEEGRRQERGGREERDEEKKSREEFRVAWETKGVRSLQSIDAQRQRGKSRERANER